MSTDSFDVAIAQSHFSTVPPGFAPEGFNPARLVRFVELGTIDIPDGKGGSKPKRQCHFTWELPLFRRQYKEGAAEAPMLISKELAFSLYGKAHLRRFLINWFGERIEVLLNQGLVIKPEKLLGLQCMIEIRNGQSPNTNLRFQEVVNLIAFTDSIPAQHNESVCLTFEHFDPKIFSKLPRWQRDKIRKSHEYPTLLKRFPEISSEPF